MSNYQTIYDRLRQHGFSQAGALGVLGNWDCESNCEPCRVQDDFSPYRTISKAYVNALNSGALTRDAFMRDQKGFGLAQWTYPTRKADMYDTWKSSGMAIDDAVFQVDFAVKEFKRDFSSDFALLKVTQDIYQAVKTVCARFENPAVHNIDARFAAAVRIKGQINLAENPPAAEEPEAQEAQTVTESEYWPPRMLCEGMKGKDVEVLCAILKARGYAIHYVTDEFGSFVKDVLVVFQRENGLDHDGIAGPMTWAKLLSI